MDDLDTGICVVMVEPSAERTFVTTLGAERRISVDSLATSDPRPGDLVCVTGFSLALASTGEPLLAWLPTLHPDVVVVLDPGAAFATLSEHVRAAMLELTDVWSSNAEEAEDILRAVGQEPPKDLAELTTAIAPLLRGDAVAIVRDGPEGCAVHVGSETTYVPASRRSRSTPTVPATPTRVP